ncbi:MAG: hypothetical protein ACOCP8_03640 [archaeon]
MTCYNCQYYDTECRNKDIDYKFLDKYKWDENIIFKYCNYYKYSKKPIIVKEVILNSSKTNLAGQIYLQISFIIIKIPVFKFGKDFICFMQGEKKTDSGHYYNLTFGGSKTDITKQIKDIEKIKHSLCYIFDNYISNKPWWRKGKRNKYRIFMNEFMIDATEAILAKKKKLYLAVNTLGFEKIEYFEKFKEKNKNDLLKKYLNDYRNKLTDDQIQLLQLETREA